MRRGRGVVIDQSQAIFMLLAPYPPPPLNLAGRHYRQWRPERQLPARSTKPMSKKKIPTSQRRRTPQHCVSMRVSRCASRQNSTTATTAGGTIEDTLHQRHIPNEMMPAEATTTQTTAGRTRRPPPPAAHTMHQPRNINRQLRRLRPQQQHAVIERVQIAMLGNPAALFHQLLMHHRDLPGGPRS